MYLCTLFLKNGDVWSLNFLLCRKYYKIRIFQVQQFLRRIQDDLTQPSLSFSPELISLLAFDTSLITSCSTLKYILVWFPRLMQICTSNHHIEQPDATQLVRLLILETFFLLIVKAKTLVTFFKNKQM